VIENFFAESLGRVFMWISADMVRTCSERNPAREDTSTGYEHLTSISPAIVLNCHRLIA